MSIPGENEVALRVWKLQQLATSRLPGRADSGALTECLTCKHLGHLPPVCFFPSEAPENPLDASKGSFYIIRTLVPLFSFLIKSKSPSAIKMHTTKTGKKEVSIYRAED